MLELATGTGLSAAAGLNAYVPILTVGLLARYTDVIELPAGWVWLSNPWLLAILAMLLVFEVAADKIPGIDHVNDILQTVVRPAAGGVSFGASAGAETVRIDNPSDFYHDHLWLGLLAGGAIAFGVHLAKAALRVAVTAVTFGFGNPIISFLEDGASITLSLAAIVIPLLAVLLLASGAVLMWFIWHWARRRLRARNTQSNVPADEFPHPAQ